MCGWSGCRQKPEKNACAKTTTRDNGHGTHKSTPCLLSSQFKADLVSTPRVLVPFPECRPQEQHKGAAQQTAFFLQRSAAGSNFWKRMALRLPRQVFARRAARTQSEAVGRRLRPEGSPVRLEAAAPSNSGWLLQTQERERNEEREPLPGGCGGGGVGCHRCRLRPLAAGAARQATALSSRCFCCWRGR